MILIILLKNVEKNKTIFKYSYIYNKNLSLGKDFLPYT